MNNRLCLIFQVYSLQCVKSWMADPHHVHYDAAKASIKHVYNMEPDLTREGGSIPITLTLQVTNSEFCKYSLSYFKICTIRLSVKSRKEFSAILCFFILTVFNRRARIISNIVNLSFRIKIKFQKTLVNMLVILCFDSISKISQYFLWDGCL